MGRPVKDLTGLQFGRLTVLERDTSYPSGAGKSAYWKCLCSCGNIKSVRSDKLTNQITQSCGCLSKEVRTKMFLKDLSGEKIGKLTVLKRDNSKPHENGQFAYWICRCECGNIKSIRGDHLRDKTTQSCGCLISSGELLLSTIFQENNIKHIPQYSFPDLKGDFNQLRFDFAIVDENDHPIKLVEFQGEQHSRPWGNEPLERFEKRLEYDEKKRAYCKEKNIPLYEISFKEKNEINWEYLKNRLELM